MGKKPQQKHRKRRLRLNKKLIKEPTKNIWKVYSEQQNLIHKLTQKLDKTVKKGKKVGRQRRVQGRNAKIISNKDYKDSAQQVIYDQLIKRKDALEQIIDEVQTKKKAAQQLLDKEVDQNKKNRLQNIIQDMDKQINQLEKGHHKIEKDVGKKQLKLIEKQIKDNVINKDDLDKLTYYQMQRKIYGIPSTYNLNEEIKAQKEQFDTQSKLKQLAEEKEQLQKKLDDVQSAFTGEIKKQPQTVLQLEQQIEQEKPQSVSQNEQQQIDNPIRQVYKIGFEQGINESIPIAQQELQKQKQEQQHLKKIRKDQKKVMKELEKDTKEGIDIWQQYNQEPPEIIQKYQKQVKKLQKDLNRRDDSKLKERLPQYNQKIQQLVTLQPMIFDPFKEQIEVSRTINKSLLQDLGLQPVQEQSGEYIRENLDEPYQLPQEQNLEQILDTINLEDQQLIEQDIKDKLDEEQKQTGKGIIKNVDKHKQSYFQQLLDSIDEIKFTPQQFEKFVINGLLQNKIFNFEIQMINNQKQDITVNPNEFNIVIFYDQKLNYRVFIYDYERDETVYYSPILDLFSQDIGQIKKFIQKVSPIESIKFLRNNYYINDIKDDDNVIENYYSQLLVYNFIIDYCLGDSFEEATQLLEFIENPDEEDYDENLAENYPELVKIAFI